MRVTSNGYRIAVFLALCTFAVGQDREMRRQGIVWDSMNHSTIYELIDLGREESSNITDQVGYLSSSELFYCKKSGCVLHVFPKKQAFVVLVFPSVDQKVDTFVRVNQRVLLDIGLNIELIEKLLNGKTVMGGYNPSFGIRIQAESRSPKKAAPASVQIP